MKVDVNLEIESLNQIRDELKGLREELGNLVSQVKEIVVALTPPEAAKIAFFVEEGGQLKPIGGSMFQKVTEAKKFAIKITDKFGNDAKIDGLPAWAADESLADLVVAEDGLSAVVTPKGPVGSFKLQVKADADLGEGVKELLGELAIDLVAGDAEVIAISEVPAV